MLRAALLALTLLFAGCLGDKEAPTAASEEPEGTLGAASAAGTGADAANATLDDAANASVAHAPLAFSYTGSTPEGVCGPAGCNFVTDGSEDFHIVEHEGHPTSMTVTVTYSGVRPGMEFYMGVCLGAGETEAEVTCRDYTTGASPLAITFDLADHVPGNQIALSAGALNGASTATGLLLFTSSEFSVEGTLTFGEH